MTQWYRPLEVVLGSCCYEEAVDMWSCGCTYVEMLTMRSLFQGDHIGDDAHKRRTQAHAIISILGTPSKSDAQVLSQDTVRYLWTNLLY